MKGFEKGLSPSKSNAIHNLSSSGWVENDENDSSGDKLIPQFENHKITFGKHFTSAAQRKKILAEINEIPSVSDSQNHKNSNLDLENSSPKMGISDGVVSCSDRASEPRDDSSVKDYDPYKNFLSPRPQYLRFNPNRRHEMLKRLEKESIDELNSSLDSDEVKDEEESSAEEIHDSSLSPPEVCVVNQRDGGISEEDNDNLVDVYEVEEEEEEEEVEEKRWCLRGVLNLLLTLTGCLLSTSYICSMNSPTNSPIQQAIWNLKDSGLVIKNGTLEFVSTRLHDDGLFEVEVGGKCRGIEEVQIYKENYGEIDESFEAEIVEYLEWHEKEMVGNENGDSEDMVDEAAESEGVGAAQFDFEVDKLQHLIDANADENIDDGSILLDEEIESSRVGLDEDNASKDDAAETEIIGSGEVDSEPQSSSQLIGAKTVESEDESESMWEMEIDSSIQLQGPELSLKSISDEIPMESKEGDDTGSLEELVGSHGELSDSMDEVDEIGDETEVGMEKSEWNISTVVGVSAVIIVLTSLAIIYPLKKSRRSTSSKESEPVLKQKFAVEENVIPVLPSIEKKVEFLARASLSSHSVREAPRAANHIHAPTVELIGEIVVGQPSSLGSSGKYQMTISDDEYYATLSQKPGSLPQLVSAPSQPSATELHPTTSSTSYGSFTTERKISKKEGSQSREAMIGTTPVRRSSRLRNRSAIMSP